MKKVIKVHSPQPVVGNSRRQFLKMSGMAVAGAGFLFACNNDDDNPGPTAGVFDLGTGDLGILNYAYALEQLEAAYYTRVVNSFYSGISDLEKQTLTDLYYHELIHRDFFATAIASVANPEQVLPTLEFNFDAIDFNNRDQVLATTKVLEDTGVMAYNGAARYITNPDYLVIAGKIVSVEARHASAVATLINPGSKDFAGDSILVDLGGVGLAFDGAKKPSEILAAVVATGFVKTAFTANGLQ